MIFHDRFTSDFTRKIHDQNSFLNGGENKGNKRYIGGYSAERLSQYVVLEKELEIQIQIQILFCHLL